MEGNIGRIFFTLSPSTRGRGESNENRGGRRYYTHSFLRSSITPVQPLQYTKLKAFQIPTLAVCRVKPTAISAPSLFTSDSIWSSQALGGASSSLALAFTLFATSSLETLKTFSSTGGRTWVYL
ncbi:hypothetical protein V2G26_006755 [Clonostachys chloroleuca]